MVPKLKTTALPLLAAWWKHKPKYSCLVTIQSWVLSFLLVIFCPQFFAVLAHVAHTHTSFILSFCDHIISHTHTHFFMETFCKFLFKLKPQVLPHDKKKSWETCTRNVWSHYREARTHHCSRTSERTVPDSMNKCIKHVACLLDIHLLLIYLSL